MRKLIMITALILAGLCSAGYYSVLHSLRAVDRNFYAWEGNTVKNMLCAAVGLAGSWLASLFGGWDAALSTLLLFMGIDYVTGLVVAGVFHRSKKTDTGKLESRAGWKGLCRKGETMLIVLVAYRLDVVIGSTYIRDAAIIAFLANETISIIENAGLMGIPIPAVLARAIETLKGGEEREGDQK